MILLQKNQHIQKSAVICYDTGRAWQADGRTRKRDFERTRTIKEN